MEGIQAVEEGVAFRADLAARLCQGCEVALLLLLLLERLAICVLLIRVG